MVSCAEPHVNMNYMHAPDYELQMRFLKRYMAEVASSQRKLTLVLSVGYWVWTPDVPQVHLTIMPYKNQSLWRSWRRLLTVLVKAHHGIMMHCLIAGVFRLLRILGYEGAQDCHCVHRHCSHDGARGQAGALLLTSR